MTRADLQPLTDALLSWNGAAHMQRMIGTGDGDAIHGLLDEFCRLRVGSAIAAYHFATMSLGAVFGVRLANGRDVVVKAYEPWKQDEFLREVLGLQAFLHDEGFPCARPLAGPHPFAGDTRATVTSRVEPTTPADAHQPPIRAAMAGTLARATELARLYDETSRGAAAAAIPMIVLPTEPDWPYSVDRETHGGGADDPLAAQIDAVAGRALAELRAIGGPQVVAHLDWSVKNFAIGGDGSVVSVFDWDSVVRCPLVLAVGYAAALFPATWALDVPKTPTPVEARAFVAEFEAARGTPFDPPDRALVDVATTYLLSTNARMEHAQAGDSPPRAGDMRWAWQQWCAELDG